MGKIAIIILIILIIIKGCGMILSKIPAVPKNYMEKVKTGGNIESKYLKMGGYDVDFYEETILQGFSKYTIYYPSELQTTNKKYPVIVISNGSGTPVSKYLSVLKHYASWGFIVIGTEEEYDWSGFSAEMCVRHLQKLNDNQKIGDNESIFFQKVDFENIGIVGHSQGGIGVINAITEQKNKNIYKTAVSLSPTNKELAHNLEWDYDATLVNIPILLIAGAGGGDDWVLTGSQLQDIYSDINSDKVALRRKNTAHNEVLYSANGYVIAWFMYYLQNDNEAKKAFVSDSPEIENNKLYQDVEINITNSGE